MKIVSESYIVDGIRTPIGKLGGSLSSIRSDDLAALVIKELLDRNPSVDPNAINDVIFGCANQAGEDNRNVARMASLLAGLPFTVPGETVNRLCASGMSATINASRAIKLGDGDLYISGGVENMTRAPLVQSKAENAFSGKVEIYDSTLGWRFINPKMQKLYGTHSMGQTAENLVEKYNITREEQDSFAYHSHRKADRSTQNGRLGKEIVPVLIPQKKSSPLKFEHDEFIKPETTREILAKLRPVFKENGSVTAGNSSGLNDGACSLLVASEESLIKFSLKPMVKIVSSAVVGVEPRIMGIGPVGATKKALAKVNLSLDQMDVIELNEAFASQSLAVLKELNINPSDERLNPNGGAIALGHPLGMSGARLILSASHELIAKKGKYALCTMCIGVGQGMAIIIENSY
ncbi:MAG: 3-oxoadipyl-CoA thiolase [Melioribacteraceae bacterium]|nr:3-oxoadipyl-CoA thiolase [Melioribacteraceae bacterium]MCF8263031.1 3-oxoadipyl-CoA thiolase [Melioribacteraceae bacterium]MCF8414115.1 3-oxoadipyl-CoA thiolase [Melioribacteraceae bacterium]MCF8430476.1 3-oxoadipyl-CoA thiolase [Melioribacteraceae bacterium]